MNKDKITLPVIPLRGITIFPNMIIHFDIGREKSIAALEEAMLQNGEIFLVSQINPEVENPSGEDIYNIGTICKVKQILKLPKDITRILVEGIERAEVVSVISEDTMLKANVEKYLVDNEIVETNDDIAYRNLLGEAFAAYISATEGDNSKVVTIMKEEDNLSRITDLIAAYIQLPEEKKQIILETIEVHSRIEKLITFINEEVEIVNIEKVIGKKVKNKIDKNNKEFFLREQIKAIQEELGENEEKNEIDRYAEKIEKIKMPKAVKEKAQYELNKLRNAYSSGDANNIRTYLDWIIALPWNKGTKDNFDINKASEVLDNEHYGLEDVKERILEYLAVKQYTKTLKGPILCLVGPPGVGKSSIAQSVANALNRKFVRISLGGVRDEAEIRGHRRTYVGAIPGRIVYGLKEAGSNNPLVLLDEIDKLSQDYKGSPADSLLEVLDQNQNKKFRDTFMEIDIDLSNVLFITTANTLDTVPRPLLDRMEVIEVSGYTYEEKYQIAKNHLIPKALKEYNLEEGIKISDKAIKEIINSYTRESGVRSLNRQVNKVIRKAITELIKSNKKSMQINSNTIEKYLGSKVFEFENIDKEDKVGVVTGLAWTAYGGDTLPVEVAIMNGSGKLELTGQLGEVMQESAKTAFSYVRANSIKYGIEDEFYKKNDIHIHVPEGAVPKDGPSAGVTLVTALVSALTNTKVKNDIAMTGEVTLTGRVLAIGGVKEKCLAAHRIGVKTIILPEENKKHVDKIPVSIKNKLNLVFADNVEVVLENALIGVDKSDN